jgi:hypothetical protein
MDKVIQAGNTSEFNAERDSFESVTQTVVTVVLRGFI